jgi:predicted membrane channel-forming protein YqfA (hemolysin III family)
MFRRINELSFVIGVFFTVVAVILLVGYFISASLSSKINLYTGIVFLVFGLAMVFIRTSSKYGSDK